MNKYFIFKKKNSFVVIGGIAIAIGAYKFTLSMAIIALICGVISRKLKSQYANILLFLGVMELIYYALITF